MKNVDPEEGQAEEEVERQDDNVGDPEGVDAEDSAVENEDRDFGCGDCEEEEGG